MCKFYDLNKDKINEKRRMFNKIDKVFCKCCDLNMRRDTWIKHIKSKNHLKNEAENKNNYITCITCKITIKKENLEKHKMSQTHLYNK